MKPSASPSTLGSRVLNRAEWETVLRSLHWSGEGDFQKPGASYAKWMRTNDHFHEFNEIVVCLRGDHLYGVDGRALRLSPGRAALLPRKVPHDALYWPRHDSCVDFWLHFFSNGAFTLNFIYHDTLRGIEAVPVRLPAVALLEDFRRAARLLSRTNNGLERRKADHFLIYLLHELFELLMETDLGSQAVDEQSVIEAVKQYIADHLTDRLTLTDLAKAAGYSPFHFHRVFLEAEGITPRLFVEGARLKLACELLKKGHSITYAAADAGFATASQFARVFKKQFRSSPRDWLKSAPSIFMAHKK